MNLMMTTIALTVARSLEEVDADLIHTFHQGMQRISTLIKEPPPYRFKMLLQGAGEGALYRYLTGQIDPKIVRLVDVHDRDCVSTYHRLQKMIDGVDAVLSIDDSRDPGDPAQPRPTGESYETGPGGELLAFGAGAGKMTLPGASRWVLESTRIASTFNIPCAYVRLGTNGERITDWHARPRLFGKKGFFSRDDVEPTQHVVEPQGGWPSDPGTENFRSAQQQDKGTPEERADRKRRIFGGACMACTANPRTYNDLVCVECAEAAFASIGVAIEDPKVTMTA